MSCRKKLLTTYKEVPIKKVMIVYLPLIGGLDRIEPRKHCVHNTASQKEEKFMPEVTMIKNNNGRDIWCAIIEVWPREILIVQLAVARPQ